MAKVTISLDEREVNTLADLIEAELRRGEERHGAYETRSIVRLALRVNELAKGRGGRWAVLNGAPTWVFAYLAKPVFPEVVSPQTLALRRARERSARALEAKPKRTKRVLPKAAGLGITPPPE